MTKPLILFHSEDPDGVISAALLTRALGSDLVYVPVGYYNVVKQFEDTAKNVSSDRPENIYISDLSINNSLALSGSSYGTLEQLAMAAPTVWFDHHPNTQTHMEELERRGFRFVTDFSNQKCASSLVQDHFGLKDEYSQELVDIALAHDLNLKDSSPLQRGELLQKIISMYLYDNDEMDRLAIMLADAEVWDREGNLHPKLVKKVERYEELTVPALEKLYHDSKDLILPHPKQNGFTIKMSGYGKSILPMKDTARMFFEKYKDPRPEICAFDVYILIRGYPTNHILVYSDPNSISSFDPVKFCQENGGGGRGNMGGFNWDEPITIINFEKVKRETCQKLEKYLNSTD